MDIIIKVISTKQNLLRKWNYSKDKDVI